MGGMLAVTRGVGPVFARAHVGGAEPQDRSYRQQRPGMVRALINSDAALAAGP